LGADLDGGLRVCRSEADERRRKHGAPRGRRLQESPSIQLVFASHDFPSLLDRDRWRRKAAGAGRRIAAALPLNRPGEMIRR
jgi:hypothetical protein